jgi:hypothetical protein
VSPLIYTTFMFLCTTENKCNHDERLKWKKIGVSRDGCWCWFLSCSWRGRGSGEEDGHFWWRTEHEQEFTWLILGWAKKQWAQVFSLASMFSRGSCINSSHGSLLLWALSNSPSQPHAGSSSSSPEVSHSPVSPVELGAPSAPRTVCRAPRQLGS